MRFVPGRDSRKPLSLQVRFVQAADDQWVIEARGVKFRVCGILCAGDVFRRINGSFYK